MLMEFIAPPVGWAQYALVGRFPVLLSAYPAGFVMIGQRVWELFIISIISKPHPLQKFAWVPGDHVQWSLRYACVAFIAPPIGWAQHASVGRFPVQLWTYPPLTPFGVRALIINWHNFRRVLPLQGYNSNNKLAQFGVRTLSRTTVWHL